jgi:hypothetical protein
MLLSKILDFHLSAPSSKALKKALLGDNPLFYFQNFFFYFSFGSYLLYLYWSPPLPDFLALSCVHVILILPTCYIVFRRWSVVRFSFSRIYVSWAGRCFFIRGMGISNWAGRDPRTSARRVAAAFAWDSSSDRLDNVLARPSSRPIVFPVGVLHNRSNL